MSGQVRLRQREWGGYGFPRAIKKNPLKNTRNHVQEVNLKYPYMVFIALLKYTKIL